MSYHADSGRHGWLDLAAVVALVVAFDAAVVLPVDFAPLRVALGLPVLLLAPGYALAVALYPRGGRTDPERLRAADSHGGGRSVDPLGSAARLGLSVVLSVVTVAGVALAVNASPWPIRTVPMLAGLTAATLLAVAAAAVRRRRVPAPLRYGPSLPSRSVARAFRPRLSATFVLGLLLVATAVGATAVLATTDTDRAGTDEEFTEFLALTANGTGEYVTANYTDAVETDRPLYVRVVNGEGSRTDYTVVFVRETVTAEGNQTTVRDATERARRQVTLRDGARTLVEFDPRPPDNGSAVRLRAYLYRGDAPDRPAAASAYRTMQIWYVDDPIATARNATAGNATAGTVTAGATAGNTTAGNATAGNATAGNTTAGNATAGNATAGNVTAGNATAGNATAGNATAGNATVALADG
ncbi:DUF1616 domain-containing protein [Halosimplex marinum]|uniref:DUF1616 domain-containing protein n=1 Tax=Halosimplex marinum TaxID=3396620 RepID=UPI003F55FBCA